jgi:hypothetical protein
MKYALLSVEEKTQGEIPSAKFHFLVNRPHYFAKISKLCPMPGVVFPIQKNLLRNFYKCANEFAKTKIFVWKALYFIFCIPNHLHGIKTPYTVPGNLLDCNCVMFNCELMNKQEPKSHFYISFFITFCDFFGLFLKQSSRLRHFLFSRKFSRILLVYFVYFLSVEFEIH